MSEKDVKIAQQLQRLAGAVDRFLEDAAGDRVAFSIMVWPESKMDRFQYIANCSREDVLRVMKEATSRWESSVPHTPAHEIQ